jgi:hypothetical protein
VLAPDGQLAQTIAAVQSKRKEQQIAAADSERDRERRQLLLGDANHLAFGGEDQEAALLSLAAIAAKSQLSVALRELDDPRVKGSPQVDWLRAWLAVQAGDRETARAAVAAGKSRNPSPTTLRALEQLEEMVR